MGSLALLLSIIALGGCGGGGSSSSAPTPPQPVPFSAATLVANAGPDQKLAVLGTVQTITLDGSNSFFRPDSTTTRAPSVMAWALVSGPPTNSNTPVIANSAAALTSVTFPASPSPGTYTFRLTATEGTQSATDSANVVVKPFIVAPLGDLIQMGFTPPSASSPLTRTITASLVGTPSGAVTYAWTNPDYTKFTPFFTATGTATNAITFTVPKLTDLETPPSQSTILGLWAHAGGYHTLVLTATDAAGNTDSESAVVSFGVATNGLKNVPINIPTYLNGGASAPGGPLGGGYVFSFLGGPNAQATIPLFGVDNSSLGTAGTIATPQQVVWFAPKTEGQYTWIVEHDVVNSGVTTTATTVFTINAAQYVSNGLVATVAPNPSLGQCGGCHGGSVPFLDDMVTQWLTTGHSHAFSDFGLASTQGSANLVKAAAELAASTTGFYLGRVTGTASSQFSGANGGFGNVASAQGIPGGRTGALAVASFQSRFPESARLTNVQCEVCHGPGSLHSGDSSAIAVSLKVDVCARCHSHEPSQWANSKHSQVVSGPDTYSACVRCHTAEGAHWDAAVKFSYSTDPTAPNPPPVIAVPDIEGRMNSATCATCHDPHSRRDASDTFQLRVAGDFVMPDGTTVHAGESATCLRCHNSRRSWKTPAVAANRNDAHPGLQGDMVTGSNGAEFASFTYVRSPHSNPALTFSLGASTGQPWKWCISCHMAGEAPPGDPAHDRLGGHSFAMSAVSASGAQVVNTAACDQCHTVAPVQLPTSSGVTTLFGTSARADYDGNGSATPLIQQKVAGLLQLMGGSTMPTGDNPFGVVGLVSGPSVVTSGLLIQLAQAIPVSAYAAPAGKTIAAVTGLESSHGRLVIDVSLAGGGTAQVAIPSTADGKGDILYKAAWNHFFVIGEKSYGIHNTGYAIGLLQSSVLNLRAAIGLADDAQTRTIRANPFQP